MGLHRLLTAFGVCVCVVVVGWWAGERTRHSKVLRWERPRGAGLGKKLTDGGPESQKEGVAPTSTWILSGESCQEPRSPAASSSLLTASTKASQTPRACQGGRRTILHLRPRQTQVEVQGGVGPRWTEAPDL